MKITAAVTGLLLAALPLAPASGQQDEEPTQVVVIEEQGPTDRTALGMMDWEEWGGGDEVRDLPLYVRENIRPQRTDGPGIVVPFCGPFTPTCPE